MPSCGAIKKTSDLLPALKGEAFRPLNPLSVIHIIMFPSKLKYATPISLMDEP